MTIAPLIAIAFSAIISRKSSNSWFSPGSMFALSWLFFMLMPILFAPDFFLNYYGLWFIAIIVMSCSSGGIVASVIKNKNTQNNNIQDFASKDYYNRLFFSLNVFNIISLFGLAYLIFYLSAFYQIYQSSNLWFDIPNLISVDRYRETLSYPLLAKYALYFIYPGSIISGILLSYYELNILKKILCICPLLFCIILGIIEGSRTSIILGLILITSSFFGSYVSLINKKPNFSIYKLISIFFVFIMLFITLFVFVQWLRQGLNPIIFEYLFERIRAYFFGYLPAFTLWFANIESVIDINSFLSTFAGPLNLVGALDRDLGFYEPIDISIYNSTNIFTVFRSIVSDFSPLGAIILFFIIGFYFQLEFQKKRKNLFNGIIPISIFYSFTLYSPLISIFHYNSIFFSWVLIFFILKMK